MHPGLASQAVANCSKHGALPVMLSMHVPQAWDTTTIGSLQMESVEPPPAPPAPPGPDVVELPPAPPGPDVVELPPAPPVLVVELPPAPPALVVELPPAPPEPDVAAKEPVVSPVQVATPVLVLVTELVV